MYSVIYQINRLFLSVNDYTRITNYDAQQFIFY